MSLQHSRDLIYNLPQTRLHDGKPPWLKDKGSSNISTEYCLHIVKHHSLNYIASSKKNSTVPQGRVVVLASCSFMP